MDSLEDGTEGSRRKSEKLGQFLGKFQCVVRWFLGHYLFLFTAILLAVSACLLFGASYNILGFNFSVYDFFFLVIFVCEII